MLTAQDAIRVGDAELERGLRAAWAVAVLTACVALFAFLWWVFWRDPLSGYVFGGIVGCGSVLCLALILQAHLRGQGHVSGVMEHNKVVFVPQTPKILDGATVPQLPAPTLPTLPVAEDDLIPMTRNGRAVEPVARNLLHGFEPKDVEYFCRYLANGGRFTEAAMERMPLPYGGGVMGKAVEGSNYTRFMGVCVAAGVIVGREGKKSGELAIFTAPEMMTAIKGLGQIF